MDLVHLQFLYNSFIFHASRSSIKVVCLKDCVLFCTWLHHNVWLGCDIDRRRNGRPTIGASSSSQRMGTGDGRPPTPPVLQPQAPSIFGPFFYVVFKFNMGGLRMVSDDQHREWAAELGWDCPGVLHKPPLRGWAVVMLAHHHQCASHLHQKLWRKVSTSVF